MSIGISGTPVAVAATSVTLPAHAVGQHIFLFVNKSSTGAITKPGAGGTVPAWQDVVVRTTTCPLHVVYFKATATNHTSGTWTGATRIEAIVLDGVDPTDPLGQVAGNGGTASASGGPVAPALSPLQNADGSSLIFQHYYMANTATGSGWSAAPSGYTRQVEIRASGGIGACLNTKDVTTSAPAIAQPLALNPTGNGWNACQVEVMAAPAAAAGNTGAFFAMF